MSIQISANTHKFLLDKFQGNTDRGIKDFIDDSLASLGIFENDSRACFREFVNLVDFPNIFIDVLNHFLVERWANTNETWRIWVNNYSLNDYRESFGTAIGMVDQPYPVNETTEYKNSEFLLERAAESAKLTDYGRKAILTRQVMINDDISSLNAFIASIAATYDKLIGDHVYKNLLENRVLGDGKELFHADRNNTFPIGGIKANLVGAIEAMTMMIHWLTRHSFWPTVRIQTICQS